MDTIKVLIVDDSAFMRKVIADIVNSDPSLEVIGKARDGRDALREIEELDPDVVTMDVEMPGLDGLSALQEIMKTRPLPVIMLSSVTRNGTEQTIRALQLGAVDFLTKPSGQISLDIDTLKDEIIRKIKIVAGTKKRLQNVNKISEIRPIIPINPNKLIESTRQLNKLVLIGTSTGGPKALHQVIPSLPASINAGIMIVQHMPPGFTKSLAERLDSISQIKVKEAENGEVILPGCAYIAPGDYHFNVNRHRNGNINQLLVKLSSKPPRSGHRPSVDEMLESVAISFGRI
jgi:two-component system chemotaxis response regulator CheB